MVASVIAFRCGRGIGELHDRAVDRRTGTGAHAIRRGTRVGHRDRLGPARPRGVYLASGGMPRRSSDRQRGVPRGVGWNARDADSSRVATRGRGELFVAGRPGAAMASPPPGPLRGVCRRADACRCLSGGATTAGLAILDTMNYV